MSSCEMACVDPKTRHFYTTLWRPPKGSRPGQILSIYRWDLQAPVELGIVRGMRDPSYPRLDHLAPHNRSSQPGPGKLSTGIWQVVCMRATWVEDAKKDRMGDQEWICKPQCVGSINLWDEKLTLNPKIVCRQINSMDCNQMTARADTWQEPLAEDEEGPLLQQQHNLILPEVHQETTAADSRGICNHGSIMARHRVYERLWSGPGMGSNKPKLSLDAVFLTLTGFQTSIALV